MARKSALQSEIQQSKPFRSLGHEAILGLFRTADILRRDAARAMEPAGITYQQYNVLRILRGAGQEGLPTLAIADRMIEKAPGITRLIDRLAEKGLVCRESVAGDRRRVQCQITAAGLELLASLDPRINASDKDLLSMLSLAEQEQLILLLDRVREAKRKSTG
jgi:DNA-binding MarR family transcriptional regulator